MERWKRGMAVMGKQCDVVLTVLHKHKVEYTHTHIFHSIREAGKKKSMQIKTVLNYKIFMLFCPLPYRWVYFNVHWSL